jgi:hypothetical protein
MVRRRMARPQSRTLDFHSFHYFRVRNAYIHTFLLERRVSAFLLHIVTRNWLTGIGCLRRRP